MGLFSFKKKEPVTEEQKRWDFLWELWRLEEVPSPYNILMTYYKEIKKLLEDLNKEKGKDTNSFHS